MTLQFLTEANNWINLIFVAVGRISLGENCYMALGGLQGTWIASPTQQIFRLKLTDVLVWDPDAHTVHTAWSSPPSEHGLCAAEPGAPAAARSPEVVGGIEVLRRLRALLLTRVAGPGEEPTPLQAASESSGQAPRYPLAPRGSSLGHPAVSWWRRFLGWVRSCHPCLTTSDSESASSALL